MSLPYCPPTLIANNWQELNKLKSRLYPLVVESVSKCGIFFSDCGLIIRWPTAAKLTNCRGQSRVQCSIYVIGLLKKDSLQKTANSTCLLRLHEKPQGVHSSRLYTGISIRENEKNPKVSNYFAYYPKITSSLMERTQKYHRIVKRFSEKIVIF